MMVKVLCSIHVLINKHERIPNYSEIKKILNFLVDYSITDAKLCFETPAQLGMMTDDTFRLVCVCILLRESFS